MKAYFRAAVLVLGMLVMASPCYGLISVGFLTKEKAKEMGIVMKQRKNGEAGVKVWIEFKKEGFMADLTYCELRMEDAEGEHLVSARLEPNSGVYGLEEGVECFAFSVEPGELEKCSFFVVVHQGLRTGVGYYLPVKDFFETPKRIKAPE